MIEFQKYPKTPRLFRNCVITEKIDGTNSGIQVVGLGDVLPGEGIFLSTEGAIEYAKTYEPSAEYVEVDGVHYAVAAQSRNRLITPGKETDNHGFAGWVYENAETLARTLGPGIHFGEWWGQGIQRRYGMESKKFSLFNTARWRHLELESPLPSLSVVPTLWMGPFDTASIRQVADDLRVTGSAAAPGFMDPEGVMVFHCASYQTLKYTLKNDEEPKGLSQ